MTAVSGAVKQQLPAGITKGQVSLLEKLSKDVKDLGTGTLNAKYAQNGIGAIDNILNSGAQISSKDKNRLISLKNTLEGVTSDTFAKAASSGSNKTLQVAAKQIKKANPGMTSQEALEVARKMGDKELKAAIKNPNGVVIVKEAAKNTDDVAKTSSNIFKKAGNWFTKLGTKGKVGVIAAGVGAVALGIAALTGGKKEQTTQNIPQGMNYGYYA